MNIFNRLPNLIRRPYVWVPVGIILILLLSFVVMNASYITKQVGYLVNPPEPQIGQQTQLEANRLTIPSLGINTPITEPTASNETAFQEALKGGVVRYPGTAHVGQAGNAYIFGHSSDFAFKGGDYKTVFALLPQIKLGEEILVSDKEANTFRYIVTESFVASSTDVHLLDQNTNGEKILTLQTSYPIGTALKRWIVKAKLAE